MASTHARRTPAVRPLLGGTAALLLLLAACGGGGGDGSVAPVPTPPAPPAPPAPPTPPVTSLALRVAVDTVRPGTLARVIVPGGGAPTQVDGTIAGAPVGFARQDDSTLVAIVPEVPPGVQAVRIPLAGRTGEATLSVLAGVAIANPTAVIVAELDAAVAAYASATPPAGVSSTDWQRARTAIDSVAAEVRRKLPAASAADQLAAARLLTATRVAAKAPIVADVAGGPLSDALASPWTATSRPAGVAMPIAVTTACARAIGSASLSVGALYAGLGVMVGGAFVPGVNALLAPVGGLIAYRAAPAARADVAALPEACYVPEGIAVQSLGSTLFESGRAVTADVVLRARALGGADARDGAVARVTDAVEAVLAAVRGLPASLAGIATQLPARLATLPTLPATARPLAAGDVRVVSVTPSTVTVGASGSGTSVLLTATTTATAETPFTATLALADDPTMRATVSGTVRPAGAVSVTVSPATATITGLQQSLRLTATVTGATSTAVRWSSSDLQVADVSADGTVTSRAPGTVTIRATSEADPAKSAQATITVTSGIAITLTPPSASVPLGSTVRLTATLTGTNSTGVVWSSSNAAVASVSAAGDVTGLALGTTQIRATAAYDLSVSATATVTVTPGAVTISVSPASVSLQVGQTQRLTATVTGTTATGILWSSSNPAVASVDDAGTVTARGTGTATIIARPLSDLTRSATATVTVGGSAPGGITRLTSGVAQSSLSGAEDGQRTFVITVPTGATRLDVRTSGGTGDVDLYVRRGQPPAGSTWDCNSTGDANTESCAITSPMAGEWYITLLGYEAYAGVSLTATVTTGSGGTTPPPSADGVVLLDQQNLAGSQGSQLVFTLPVPSGYSRLEITLESSLGDLYVRRGARAEIDPLRPALVYTADCASLESNYDTERCVFQAPSGTYYITVYGYHAYSGSRVRAVAYR